MVNIAIIDTYEFLIKALKLVNILYVENTAYFY